MVWRKPKTSMLGSTSFCRDHFVADFFFLRLFRLRHFLAQVFFIPDLFGAYLEPFDSSVIYSILLFFCRFAQLLSRSVEFL